MSVLLCQKGKHTDRVSVGYFITGERGFVFLHEVDYLSCKRALFQLFKFSLFFSLNFEGSFLLYVFKFHLIGILEAF